jgi:nucleoside 2-deoxyribosyltransferase
MKMVYLAGPINGCTDEEANGWRHDFIERFAGSDFAFLDPMVRDYRGVEDDAYEEIINGDLDDIDSCDIFLCNASVPSWGTAMELFYAFTSDPRTVIVVVPEGTRISPWVRGHTHYIVNTFDEAEKIIRGLA